METIDHNSAVDIAFQLKWKSRNAHHVEGYAARNVNLWRDWLPKEVHQVLLGRQSWEQVQVHFEPGALFSANGGPQTITRKQFSMSPQIGRFYPKGRLSGLTGVFPQNMQPFRCVEVNNGQMDVVLTHPLAGKPLEISMTLGQISAKEYERGGSSIDWVGLLAEGPGMQARWQNEPTDFFSGEPFKRRNEQSDTRFYDHPRLVHHIDETARDMVADLYDRFVSDGMHVLDLMSSWTSHLPPSVRPARVSGLGLNATELEQNPVLTDHRVHNLNADPALPYKNNAFDVVICSVSVEYLIDPLAVFAEVARVLKPGGKFVVTFSNRWFSPKVIQVWEQIHEFERVGLVMEYFIRNGGFDNLNTYSTRGLPRPKDDKYAAEQPLSDPVYAVWGTRSRVSI
jgi:FKBP-type peptidyl-prolyl cis-trans isomerase 2